MIFRRYVKPEEKGKGPTISMLMCENFLPGTEKCSSAALGCFCTFEFLQVAVGKICLKMTQGLWSPKRANIESMSSEGFLSLKPLRSNNVLDLSVSESPKAEHKIDSRASYLLVRGGEAITDKALVAVCESRAATT